MKQVERVMASSVVIDLVEQHVYIDGVECPWWLSEEPDVSRLEAGLHVVSLPIIVSGDVVIKREADPT